MKQIAQNLKNGKTELIDVPVPKPGKGYVLIKTHYSLVSTGTEKMLKDFGKANLLQKAIQQPDRVKDVLNKIKTDGIMPTIRAVQRKLEGYIPMGYSNAGVVVEIGPGDTNFQIGDRVVSNGPHAEFVNVPVNLVARIPDNLSMEEACFAVVGSIGLNGIRLIEPGFGESIAVLGLGLIGLITVQLLQAKGCRVIGFDLEERKVELVRSWGIDAYNTQKVNPVKAIKSLNFRDGVDGVLIAASSQSNQIISQAANMCRKKGKIVLIGVAGLNLKRSDFYEKELSFQVACSYGPGRYDPEYEEKARDYPLPYVRWTAKRNFGAVMEATVNGAVNLKSLITDKVKLEDYKLIYDNLDQTSSIARLISYSTALESTARTIVITDQSFSPDVCCLAVVGAGNFTKSIVLPILKRLNANVKYIISERGMNASQLAKKYKIPNAGTDYLEALQDKEVNTLYIATRHNLHANMVINGLLANKHVFVEKPLALNREELKGIEKAYSESKGSLMVGYNRRFSPIIREARQLIEGIKGPFQIVTTVNAGYIPADHWVQDMDIGGGRIIGEACHFIDLASFIFQSRPQRVIMNAMGNHQSISTDNAILLLKYANGSQASINFFSNGHKKHPKERIEIYCQGRIIVIDNFRRSQYFGFDKKGFRKRQDKGHFSEFKIFYDSITKVGQPVIPFDNLIHTSKTSFAALQSLQEKRWIDVE